MLVEKRSVETRLSNEFQSVSQLVDTATSSLRDKVTTVEGQLAAVGSKVSEATAAAAEAAAGAVENILSSSISSAMSSSELYTTVAASSSGSSFA